MDFPNEKQFGFIGKLMEIAEMIELAKLEISPFLSEFPNLVS